MNGSHPEAIPSKRNSPAPSWMASIWEVIEQIQLATSTSSEFQLGTHMFDLGIDDEVAYRMESTSEDYWSRCGDHNSLTSITNGQAW
jgi:hypothetical protein